MSRIWRALKEAEREKSRPASRGLVARRATPEVQRREVGDRRASKRTIETVLLLVYGSDGDKQPFHEEAETLEIGENGCSFLIEAPVSCGQRLFLSNTVNEAELQARVVHVGRRIRGKMRIGVEFLSSAPEFWYSS